MTEQNWTVLAAASLLPFVNNIEYIDRLGIPKYAPQKPLSSEEVFAPSNTRFHGPLHAINDTSIGSTVFVWLTVVAISKTQTQTTRERPRYTCVTIIVDVRTQWSIEPCVRWGQIPPHWKGAAHGDVT